MTDEPSAPTAFVPRVAKPVSGTGLGAGNALLPNQAATSNVPAGNGALSVRRRPMNERERKDLKALKARERRAREKAERLGLAPLRGSSSVTAICGATGAIVAALEPLAPADRKKALDAVLAIIGGAA